MDRRKVSALLVASFRIVLKQQNYREQQVNSICNKITYLIYKASLAPHIFLQMSQPLHYLFNIHSLLFSF